MIAPSRLKQRTSVQRVTESFQFPRCGHSDPMVQGQRFWQCYCMASVKELLNAAEAAARARAPVLGERWIRLSHVLGSMIPNGSATEVLQEVGRLDLLIRAMEDEPDPMLHPLMPLSVTWVALSYEVVRALHQRRLDLPGLEPLLRQMELVRIPLLKFEVAQEGKNRMPPIKLYRYPPTSSDEPPELYDRSDRGRAYRPVGALTPAGLAWGVIDAAAGQTVWVTRRSLADGLLAFARTEAEITMASTPQM